ncbi:pantoate--beta-alanine ligase [Marinihelvus fidelis]|uniref:Pantothenate synthetase n=1 Tax=Marinihelvus fidelis TaxID=2613842 RepID=A0A5N0TDY0_9GAMM|nr:pantoate--beta-alanine ligase [Marinihelvus fidelis]KAA9132046.1 pantoate--beta-alanine ligase [Marinihelvus fidelis]
MNRFDDLGQWQAHRRALRTGELGFVPTMGALHAGHRSLVEASVNGNERTVVSLFVNPTQFDQRADLDAYPADLDGDLDKLRAWGVDDVLVPDYGALYPDGYRYRVAESGLSSRLCGAHRPGHFDGVLSVVMKLFNLVRPARAYFGEKDWQQLALVRGMVEAFFMPVDIVGCPTVREGDGLALSSRNQRLSPAERAMAPGFHRALVQQASADDAAQALQAAGFDVDYVEDIDGRRLGAVRLGSTRLIDNIALES